MCLYKEYKQMVILLVYIMSFIKNIFNIFSKPEKVEVVADIVDASSKTDNGALTLPTSGDDLLNLFVATVRGLNTERLYELMEKASLDSMLYTLKIVAYVRDIRGGKGERDLGRQMMEWLLKNDEKQLFANMKAYISEYGRWDDGVYLKKSNARKHYVELLANQLREDLDNMNAGKPVSLAAKWVPSESSVVNKQSGIFFSLAKNMGIKPAALRKVFITPLRTYIGVLEQYMCSKEWSKVDYEKVPSCAMLLHGKPGNAFERNDEARFNEFKMRLTKGTAKINSKILFPHEILKQYLVENEIGYNCPDELIEAQWKEIVNKMSEIGCLNNVLVLSDVSCSMNGIPMLISYTMGILISSLNKSAVFQNQVLTFETYPQLVDVGGETLHEQLMKIMNAPWGGSTNICAAFDLILEKVREHDAVMPEKIVIVSDMQFNEADDAYATNYENICMKFEEFGYKVPHIVFWNVNGGSNDFQVASNITNVSMISGFSVDILKCVLEGKNPTPIDTMMAALNNPRYDLIRCVV
jgi:hypothetical protein